MKKNKLIGIIHHGCAKNLVDTELMLGMLENAGYKTTLDADDEKVKTTINSHIGALNYYWTPATFGDSENSIKNETNYSEYFLTKSEEGKDLYQKFLEFSS